MHKPDSALSIWIGALILLLSSPVTAEFFDGYAPATSVDQQTISYANDLETRAKAQLQAIRVEPKYSIASATRFSAEKFFNEVRQAVRDVYGVQTCNEQTPLLRQRIGGWSVYDDAKRKGEFWANRLWYRKPRGDHSKWKRPVLVINDGMGVAFSVGTSAPRYPGENVAQVLAEAGHPVMVMALKGFDDKYFVGAWGTHGAYQFHVYTQVRGQTPQSIWVQDAYDALCLLKQWHPKKKIGVTGVSKSGSLAAVVALMDRDVDRVYLASGFSAFEAKFTAGGPWHYAYGERVRFEKNALILALYDRHVRLSYSSNDDISYRVEAVDKRVLTAVNAVRSVWGGARLVTQCSSAPSHYYDADDVTAFFGN